MSCLTDETVLALVLGEIDDEKRAAADVHLGACADCRTVVAETAKFYYQSENSSAALTRAVTPSEPGATSAADLPEGTMVGRYQVRGRLGDGAGGVVYRAYDHRLARPVAIKLLRTASSPARAERLLLEAQIMARLSHPHVVAVYDAGTFDGQVFIAMELIEGETLASWLARERRPWPEVLRVFVDAGRGLAAAHAADLVHRDFKPENVLLGADGRVRVTDFGLARLGSSDAEKGVLVAGTPLYMSPEQFLARGVDAKSDQFSFCVALYQALYRTHPHLEPGAATPQVATLARAVLAGAVRAPTRGTVPSWIFRVLRKGLSATPEDRHASMDVLLGLLAVPWWRSRRLAAGGVAAGLLAAAGLVGSWLVERARPSCGDGKVRAPAEECDDGNQRDDDGCTSLCLRCPRTDTKVFWPQNGHCYERHPEAVSFAQASATCQRTGSYVASINSLHELAALRPLLASDGAATHWIGLVRRPLAPKGFEWMSGEGMLSTTWAEGEPRVDGGDCARQPTEGVQWTTALCDSPAPFICEREPWIVRPTDRHAYRLFPYLTDWHTARAACAANGAHLVTIGDAAEQEFVSASVHVSIWLGADDLEREGQFRWITGEPFEYTNFAPNEPDEMPSPSDCMILGTDTDWHDRSCGISVRSLCEVD